MACLLVALAAAVTGAVASVGVSPGFAQSGEDVELRLRRAAQALVAVEEEVAGLQAQLERERGRVVGTEVERDLNRDTLARLEQALGSARSRRLELKADVERLQKEREASRRPVPPPPPAPAPQPSAPAARPEPAPAPRALAGRDCPQCPEMVSIPVGSFVMGAPSGEEEREKVPQEFRGRTSPQRAVTISDRFSLGRYEVTRGQYAAFVAATGRSAGSSCFSLGTDGSWVDRPGLSWLNPGFAQTDSDPVVCVSWDDAKAYTEWLTRTTGKTYRLPSEAEWEYAARAGTGTARYWGDGRNEACRFANVADRTAAQRLNWQSNNVEQVFQCTDNFVYTAPVGKFQANGFGLHDMLGNVWEWVEDCWNENYQGAPSTQAARRGGDCSLRVARGGGWHYFPFSVRATSRVRNTAGTGLDNRGFRVARTD